LSPATDTSPSGLRRIAPVVGLFFLAPVVGEFLLGNVSIAELPALPILALLYGSGALLIRELARGTGRGWPTMMGLGLAYGLLECGLIDQTLFNPPVLVGAPSGLPGTYVPALGLSANDALAFVVGHAVWSIGAPIAIVEALVPGRSGTRWLGGIGVSVTGVLYLLGAALIFRDLQEREHFVAPATRLVGSAAVAVGLIGIAVAVGKRRSRPVIERPAPSPLLVGVLAFVASGLFVARSESWLGVAFGLLMAVAMGSLVVRWSQHEGWGAAHRLALAGGALLTYAWLGFLLTSLLGRKGTIHLVGNIVFASCAVALLTVAVWTVRRARAAALGSQPPPR
jgi:hypothetical protein